MSHTLAGKNILVIGGSSGIGFSIVQQLAVQKANIFVANRHQSSALSELGVLFLPLDVTHFEATALAALPDTLHGVVYCPGTINLKPFNRLTISDFQKDFQVNVLGAVQVLQTILPQLKKEGASVVLFSTVAATLGMGFHASVAVSKAGVEGLTKSLAAEFATAKIRFNCIAPSLTDTPLAGNLLSTPEKREAADKRHPLGRIGTPEELAQAAIFLLSPQSSWITGQVWNIDGGMSAIK
jgi:NAD(P)-dependent dehydrogenase (short-subunit alcohol dehydrogenase family)